MINLEIEEMNKILGGGISGWGVFAIGTLVTFISGIIDGFTRPFKCH